MQTRRAISAIQAKSPKAVKSSKMPKPFSQKVLSKGPKILATEKPPRWPIESKNSLRASLRPLFRKLASCDTVVPLEVGCSKSNPSKCLAGHDGIAADLDPRNGIEINSLALGGTRWLQGSFRRGVSNGNRTRAPSTSAYQFIARRQLPLNTRCMPDATGSRAMLAAKSADVDRRPAPGNKILPDPK